MTMSKIYAGTSAFFANHQGNHDWLENNNRPFLSVVHTNKKDKKSFVDLFLNKQAVAIKENKETITLTFRKSVNAPLFRILDKS